MPLALSRLLLTALLDGEPAPERCRSYSPRHRLDGEPHEIVRTTGKQPQLELSAGRYRIEAALGSTNIKGVTELALTAGQDQKVVFKLAAGHVTLGAPTQGAAPATMCSGRSRTSSAAP